MKLQGRGISRGRAEGEVLVSDAPVSFLGGVAPATGELTDRPGGSIAGRVFAFPRGKGSTVGSYVMLEMKRVGTLPAAIINEAAEPIVATGAVLSGVPLVDGIDLSLLRNGDRCIVDGSAGTVELPDVEEHRVVSCFLQCGEEVLLLKRSEAVGSFQGHWAAVSGYVEEAEAPHQAARRELREELGLEPELVRAAGPTWVREGDTIWVIHPFLFQTKERAVTLDWEHTEYRWMTPDGMAGLKTVPGLEEVYRSLLS
jgi:predicted aconitase with swiveling domain/8-oxo-dGTP pyrophosphatase MutT (NUDIX family)